jgi:hypothetical protein
MQDPEDKGSADFPVAYPSTSRELDLAGAEKLSTAGKLGMMHPFALLAVMGMIPITGFWPFMALFAWVAVVAGWCGLTAVKTTDDKAMVAPSGAMRKGFAALGTACVLALLAGGLGETPLSFMVLNGMWAALTMAAVRSGTKTDAQSGWMAGATSQTAAALFFGVPLAFLVPGIPFTVYLTPFFSAGALWYSWKFMSSRGTDRSRAALNAAAMSALGTLAFLPATAALIGFSGFEAACHFTVALGSLLLPIWSMRNRMRPALGAGDATPATLPSSEPPPALPSE